MLFQQMALQITRGTESGRACTQAANPLSSMLISFRMKPIMATVEKVGNLRAIFECANVGTNIAEYVLSIRNTSKHLGKPTYSAMK